jgi:uncharacterized protein (DUF433 family)
MTPVAAPSLIRKTPGVSGGEACVRSSRISVWTLVNSRRLGLSKRQLLADYPTLTADDLHAAWEYYVLHPQEIDDRSE